MPIDYKKYPEDWLNKMDKKKAYIKELILRVMYRWYLDYQDFPYGEDGVWLTYKYLLHDILKIDKNECLCIKELKKMMKELKKEGLVIFSICWNIDLMTPFGSGYFLTNKGIEVARRLK